MHSLNVFYLDPNSFDVLINYCGYQKDEATSSWGPGSQDYYILHFICSGKGTLYVNGETYPLHENQIFVLFPNQITQYVKDEKEPWSYAWFALSSHQVPVFLSYLGISKETPVADFNGIDRAELNSYIDTLFIHSEKAFILPQRLQYMGICYLFLSKLLDFKLNSAVSPSQGVSVHQNQDYINQALIYIFSNFHSAISTIDVANFLRLDRSYFGRIFKQATGKTPNQMIKDLRLKRALELLSKTNLSVEEIAVAIGFENASYFSRIFKQELGICPTKYKDRLNKKRDSCGDIKNHSYLNL